mmetsp:Transcript_146568/g.470226  ORF Transcript_146568/g.470226 Transcript_146568/m.470226 type:complete len:126 (+) Transcript_146568:1151-1528(+)
MRRIRHNAPERFPARSAILRAAEPPLKSVMRIRQLGLADRRVCLLSERPAACQSDNHLPYVKFEDAPKLTSKLLADCEANDNTQFGFDVPPSWASSPISAERAQFCADPDVRPFEEDLDPEAFQY